MSMITPKTIVITAYPGKHGSISTRQPEISLLDSAVSFDDGGIPKKRRRLTHLSPDEKLLRRKLKNRVAAQTARDRKKQLMSELEDKVALLEEENKALRKQNLNLKDTSQTLVRENAALKSRLSSSTTDSTIKTESGTFRSAEGASPDSVSMDGTVLGLGHGDQPHDFLSLLQNFTTLGRGECMLQQPQAQTASSSSPCVDGGGGDGIPEAGGSLHNSEKEVVGRSSAELESLNEMIQIDHFYVKPQPQTSEPKSRDLYAGAKVEQPYSHLNNSATSATVTSEPSNPVNLPPVAEHFLALSQSDVESSLSLNLLDSFDFDSSDLPAGSESQVSVQPEAKSQGPELHTRQLFDEIYEHYLNIKGGAVPSSMDALSDSGISDEAFSPQSQDGGSLLEDIPWDDSFMDLFPGLQ